VKISAIRDAQPGDVLKDRQVPSLQLRTFTGSRSFYFYYRSAAGKQRTPKLGAWPAMSQEQARAAARAMQGKVFAAADRTAETISALCDRWLTELADDDLRAYHNGFAGVVYRRTV